jgi:O-antigen/teichoic acid export membrane protein
MLSSLFAYLQYATAIVVSIILVPLVLSSVNIRVYGLWLASSDLLAYIALLDLGVFGVLPWLVAEADGQRDEATIRRALSNATAAALLIGAAVSVAAWTAWSVFPDLLGLAAAERAALGGPLLIMLAATITTMPLNVCGAAIIGMQDVRFTGMTALTRVLLNAAITITLLLQGWQLYALAIGSAIPAAIVGVLSVARLRRRYPLLAHNWPWPSLSGLRWLARTSIGAWLGAFGWRLLSMSNGLVLTATGSPELVPLYSCTARLSVTLVQMGWIVPDSGLIGLAQLHGERRPERLQEVVRAMVRLHLIIAGAAMTVVLAFNPAFVAWWVSEALFGGHWLNGLLAAGIVAGSVTHAFATVASVLGRRTEVGLVTLANGVVQVAVAYLLTKMLGFQGLAIAAILGACLTMLPAGLRLLSAQTGVRRRVLITPMLQWGIRALPAMAAALAVGLWVPSGAIWSAGLLWLPIGMAYVWMIRPLYTEIPLDPRFRAILQMLRLVPPADASRVSAAEPVV